jgi:hypothetical protein
MAGYRSISQGFEILSIDANIHRLYITVLIKQNCFQPGSLYNTNVPHFSLISMGVLDRVTKCTMVTNMI